MVGKICIALCGELNRKFHITIHGHILLYQGVCYGLTIFKMADKKNQDKAYISAKTTSAAS